ncbi:hypothetical protein [Vibrio aquaticus]|uniref:hypothetical protein n=1 Tax=Vibrio aquaticus TaxID=2496559 RepID=UPI003F6DB18D
MVGSQDAATSSPQIEEGELNAFIESHPEVNDIYIPPTASNNSFAIVTMNKEHAGQSQQLAEKVEQFLVEHGEPKFVVLCDDDVNARDWNDIIWAITTRMDPERDTKQVLASNSQSSRLILDATNKIEGEEVEREWGTPIEKDPQLVAKIDAFWDKLGIL